MVEISSQVRLQFNNSLKEYFLSHLLDRSNHYKKMVEAVADIFQSNDLSTSEKRLQANQQILQILKQDYSYDIQQKLRDGFPSYFYAVDALLTKVPQIETVEQTIDHFKPAATDKAPLKIAKNVKFAFQKVAWGFQKIGNVFRKNKKAKHFWNRNVPTRNVTEYFLEYRLSLKLVEIIQSSELRFLHLLDDADTICRNLTYKAAHPIYSKDKPSTADDLLVIIENFDRLKKEISDDAFLKIDEIFHLLNEALKKAGTLALNNAFFSEKNNAARIAKLEKNYTTWANKIARNHRLVLENWVLCHELNLFYEHLRLASKKLCDRLNTKIYSHILKQIDSLKDYLDESLSAFKEPFTDKKVLYTAVQAERSRINGNFKKELIPNVSKFMLFQNLPSVTLGLQRDFELALGSLNTTTAIKRNFTVDQELRSTDISLINPRDIVAFECFDGLKASKDQLHHELVEINNRIQPVLIEISNIHAYTFETAKNNHETNTASIKEITSTILLGFERTFDKIEDLRKTLIQVAEKATHELDKSLNILAKDLQHLNNSDNAFQLNVKLLEFKTKDRTKSYYIKFITAVKTGFNTTIEKIKIAYTKAINLYIKTEKTLKQDSATIDSDLQNYLKAAKSSFEKLPFIYRLLFRLEPLEDYNFYVDRHHEILSLRTAFDAWEEGKYANAIAIGAKGSGLTSLFNRFTQDISEEIQINRIYPKNNISNTQELLQLLRDVFNHQKFNDIDDVAQYLVECGIKRVVLIDELQRFFLRKIHGFEVLNQLQKLIRITHKQVFWVANLAKISSFYLFKTTSLKEFFAYGINLEPLSKDRLKDLIIKRHTVSGFKLIFDESIASNLKALKKLHNRQKQEFLSNLFFEKLEKTSEGSLSLAMLQWVLAIKMHDKQTIIVNPLTSVKDILKNLDGFKVAILHALILHDGLNINELNEVLNYNLSVTRAHLASLEKDGITNTTGDLININPILHWSVLSVLTKRNLIH